MKRLQAVMIGARVTVYGGAKETWRGQRVNIGYFQAAAIVLNLNQSYTVYDNQRVLILKNHLRGLRGNNTILTITSNYIN